MAATRYVKPNPDGGWDVLRRGDRRSAVRAPTQQEAVKRARDLVRRAGGGEVRVLNRTGKVVDADTVARPVAASRRARTRSS